MKFDLKKTQYDSRVEGLFLTGVGSIGCAIILYTILASRTAAVGENATVAGYRQQTYH
jgi:hypothetical protein